MSVLMRTSLQVCPDQFLEISLERDSYLSTIPYDIIKYVILPLIQNPFIFCNESLLYSNSRRVTEVKVLSEEDSSQLMEKLKKAQYRKNFAEKFDLFLEDVDDVFPLLFSACTNSYEKIVARLLKKEGCDKVVNCCKPSFITLSNPMINCFISSNLDGRLEICKLLLAHGANPNIASKSSIDFFFDTTPLALAIEYEEKELTKLFIEHGGYVHPPLCMKGEIFYQGVREEMASEKK